MKNITYILLLTLCPAIPKTQNVGEVIVASSLEEKKIQIIQQKQDSIVKNLDSLRYDVKEIKEQQDRNAELLRIQKKLERKLERLKEDNQYKRITKEFDF